MNTASVFVFGVMLVGFGAVFLCGIVIVGAIMAVYNWQTDRAAARRLRQERKKSRAL